jgi:hypothetical protein
VSPPSRPHRSSIRRHSSELVFALFALASGCLSLSFVACGGSAPSKFPERPEGCSVEVVASAPHGQTENIGTVNAWCDEQSSDEECLKALRDQVCKVGGDVVWGVPAKPKLEQGKKKLSGRAAHSVERAAK